jgi:hypothetical protein
MTLSLIVTIAVISLFGLGLYFIITSEKKRLAKKSQLLQSMGFYPAGQPDEELVDKIQALYQRRSHQKKEVEKIHLRKEGEYKIFLYEIWDRGGKDNDLDDAWGMAIYSEYLNLPRFSLFPKVNMTGKMAALANFVIKKLVPKDEPILNFDQYETFSRRYMVIGYDQENIHKLFSERLINRLSDTEYWHIEADGKLFTYSKLEFHSHKKPDDAKQLNEKLQDLKRIFKLFNEENRILTV